MIKKFLRLQQYLGLHDRGADRQATDSGIALYYNNELRAVDDSGDIAVPLRRQALTPVDVTGISSPTTGWYAYHDGSGGNTEGPAFYNGSNWVSVVDGTTVS